MTTQPPRPSVEVLPGPRPAPTVDRVPDDWSVGPARAVPAATVGEQIVAAAAADPDAVAVRQWDRVLTYRGLVAAATRLAHELRARGVGPEVPVGICTDRQPDLITGLLAVMLSGGAFVPLEPDLPAERLREMLADTDAPVVLVDALGRRRCAGGPPMLDIPAAGAEDEPAALDCPAGADNAAYLTYTSGSTGRAKGVVVEHRQLAAHFVGHAEVTGAWPGMRAFSFSSVAFDAVFAELLLPLTIGGLVCLAGAAEKADPERLTRFLVEHRVEWGFLPPVMLPLLDPAALAGLRVLYCGGDKLGPDQVERWSAGGRRLVNCYGPTETTICVSTHQPTGRWHEPVPIGRPMPNQRLYVLDGSLRPVGVGQRGELCIGGPGVARGYHRRPGLTAAAFVPDPTVQGGRMYRSGDVASWRPDGTLAFHGRADRQVKVRGQRVEVGEVEAVLTALRGVGSAAVDAQGEQLVAYLTPADGPDEAAVREWCARRLPAAAVPARLLRVDRLPLTAADKVDLPALRARLAAADGARPPETDGQRAVAACWAAAFGTDRTIGLDEDFFAAGGHSLTAMRLVAALRARTGRAVRVSEVFAARTVAGLAAVLADAPPAVDVEPTTGHPPALSGAQRRLWFVDQLAPDAAAYNITMAERLRGPLDVPALAAALRAVVDRHRVLRWRVPHHDGTPYAELAPDAGVELPVEDVSAAADPAAALAERLAAHAAIRFDLATGPLLAARLVRLGPGEHVLSLVLHHAVFDGASAAPFYRDLAAAYDAARGAGPALGAPPATFADYVAWRGRRDERHAVADLEWWLDHLRGAPTVLELPGDRPRPAEQSYRGSLCSTTVPTRTDTAMRVLAAEVGATPSAVLLAAFAHLLRRLTGRHDLVVGTPAADRRHPAFADLVGFFVDILPVRLRVDDDADFRAAVRTAHDELACVAEHPTAALERIVDALRLPRDASRAPLVQVLFNVFNFAEPRLELSGLHTERVPAGLPGSPFDLTVYLVERDGRFALDLVYNTDLFDARRIDALLDSFVALLDRLTAGPDRPARAAALRPDADPAPQPPGRTVLDLAGRPAAVGEYGEVAVLDGDGYRTTGEHGRLEVDGGIGTATDPAAAPAPPRPAQRDQPATPPATDTERLVADVWHQVLGRAAPGVRDNFFDIGGDSMSMVTIASRLAQRLGRDVRVVDLFRYPNIRSLAEHLDRRGGDTEALDRAAARAQARRARVRQRGTTRGAGSRPGSGSRH